MGVILFKALQDVRSRRLQSLSILLLTILSAFLIGLATLILLNIDAPFQRLSDRLNGAQVWVSFPSTTSAAAIADTIKQVPMTVEVSAPLQGLDTGIIRESAKESVFVVGMTPSQPSIAQILIVDGNYLSQGAFDSTVIDQQLAKRDGLHVGDNIEIATPDGPQLLRIVGLSIDVNHGAIDQDEPRVYILSSKFDKLFAHSTQRTGLIGVRVANPALVRNYEAALSEALDTNGLPHGIGEDWLFVRDTYTQYAALSMVLLLAFGIVAIVASGFIIMNLVTGAVLAQTHDIGIMKAVGFTPGQIMRLYVAEYVSIALAGAVVGLLAGAAEAPISLTQLAGVLNTEAITGFYPLYLAGILLAIATVVAVFTVFAAARAGRINVVAAITGTFRTGRDRPSRFVTLAQAFRLPEAWVTGVGLSFARRWRVALTIATLVIAIITAIFTSTIFTTIDAYSTPAAEGIYSSALVIPALYGSDETQQLISSQPDVANYYRYVRQPYTLNTAAGPRPLALLYLSGDTRPIRTHLVQGRWYNEGAAEIDMPLSALNLYGYHVGDTIRIDKLSQSPLRIVGAYAAAYTGAPGLVSGMLAPPESEQNPGPQPIFAVTLKPHVDVHAWARTMLARSTDRVVVAVQDPNPPAQVQTLKSAMLLPTVILMLVALISVLNALLLMTRERYYDLGVLKAIGMTPREILSAVQVGSVIYALVALVIGIPLGVLVTNWGFHLIAASQGYGSVQTTISPLWLAVVTPLAIIVSLIGSYLPANRAMHVPTIVALRIDA